MKEGVCGIMAKGKIGSFFIGTRGTVSYSFRIFIDLFLFKVTLLYIDIGGEIHNIIINTYT